MFSYQPEDVYVYEGETAVFNCSYTGTVQDPYWLINNSFYAHNELPLRHQYLNRRLRVLHVRPSDNSTTYQCFLLPNTYSAIGVLYIQSTGIIQ